MASDGKHPVVCEVARGHQCRCTNCGGALHGWEGGIALARAAVVDREDRRREIDRSWNSSFTRDRNLAKSRAVCTDSVRIDLIDWLASAPRWLMAVRLSKVDTPTIGSPHGELLELTLIDGPTIARPRSDSIGDDEDSEIKSTTVFRSSLADSNLLIGTNELTVVDYTEQFANAIARSTYKELDKAFEGVNVKSVRRQLVNHFWCDLFAALAQALDELGKKIDKIPEYVIELILKSTKHGKRSLILKFAVRFAVNKAWAALTKLPIFSLLPIAHIVLALRVLAILTCPAPESHKEVQEECMKPLAKQILRAETIGRLKAVLFRDWDIILRAGPEAGLPGAVSRVIDSPEWRPTGRF